MAELVDALDSKSSFFGSVGSIPTQGTNPALSGFYKRLILIDWYRLCVVLRLAPDLPGLSKTNGLQN